MYSILVSCKQSPGTFFGPLFHRRRRRRTKEKKKNTILSDELDGSNCYYINLLLKSGQKKSFVPNVFDLSDERETFTFGALMDRAIITTSDSSVCVTYIFCVCGADVIY